LTQLIISRLRRCSSGSLTSGMTDARTEAHNHVIEQFKCDAWGSGARPTKSGAQRLIATSTAAIECEEPVIQDDLLKRTTLSARHGGSADTLRRDQQVRRLCPNERSTSTTQPAINTSRIIHHWGSKSCQARQLGSASRRGAAISERWAIAAFVRPRAAMTRAGRR
jgi:hypothetical protein